MGGNKGMRGNEGERHCKAYVTMAWSYGYCRDIWGFTCGLGLGSENERVSNPLKVAHMRYYLILLLSCLNLHPFILDT